MGKQRKVRLTKTTSLLALFVVAAVVSVMVGVIVKSDSKTSTNESSASQQAKKFEIKKACDVVSQAKAVELLGGTAVLGELGDSATASSEDIDLTKCRYLDSESSSTFSGDTSGKELSIVVRSPKNGSGLSANQKVFDEAFLPLNSELVDGVGEKSFWNKEFGQLNILDGQGVWYTVEFGSRISANRALDETKRAAVELLPRQ